MSEQTRVTVALFAATFVLGLLLDALVPAATLWLFLPVAALLWPLVIVAALLGRKK